MTLPELLNYVIYHVMIVTISPQGVIVSIK